MGITATCNECYKDLTLSKAEIDSDGNIELVFEPCSECLENAKDESFASGAEKGQESGYEIGHADGMHEAQKAQDAMTADKADTEWFE